MLLQSPDAASLAEQSSGLMGVTIVSTATARSSSAVSSSSSSGFGDGCRLPSTSSSCSSCSSTQSQHLYDDLNNDYELRRLCPLDFVAVKRICSEAFPIEYPDNWYDDVVGGKLLSYGLFYQRTELTSLIVAEIKPLCHCNVEDRDIYTDPNARVIYILSLAVDSRFRRKGIATMLLNYLINFVAAQEYPQPKVIYLHVLNKNHSAIKFYRQNGFRYHTTLLNYYRIGSTYFDGLTYVLYVNGTRPPWSLYEMCSVISSFLCFPLRYLFKLKFIFQ
uniref:N-alpha-acetyltransferase 60 n=1 Tax=Steinernema glaseri TaxID=37863 RepID=A0A1I7Y799_9BILA